MHNIRFMVAVAVGIAGVAPAMAADVRTTIPLTRGWRFHLGALPEAAVTGETGARWDTVAMPHNWNRMGGTATRGPEYQNVYGPGWYRLTFPTPAGARGRRAWLDFGAASIVADVWLNGVKLGRHEGAFARFRLDATGAMKPAGENLLVVRVDNSKPEAPNSPTAHIAPMSGDWPMYGGLYRPVSLVLTAPMHIAMDDFGGPGVYARTEKVEGETASIAVVTRLNGFVGNQWVRAEATIRDADGRQVARAESAANGREVRQSLTVPKARLWSGVADPYLYRVHVTLRDQGGRVLDEVEEPLGIRTMRIDPQTGFYLNGKTVKLRGVSKHQDRPVKGWAISDADTREDMGLIKEIGANTVRFAHYQHSPLNYRLTDEAGMVAWAEVPLVDRSSPKGTPVTGDAFAANSEQQLRELIRQNYNHPSIAVWSIANEINLDAARGLGASNARPLLERLQRVVHEEDPSRPATMADCCGAGPAEPREGLDTLPGITDVIGHNRYFGWYRPDVETLTSDMERLRRLYPKQAISISEYGAGGALTQHSDDPRGGPVASYGRPHPEEYQNYVLEENWKQIDRMPFLWASWVWNMFDFSNETRLEGDITDTNDKGLVTFDRKIKKDGFWFFKANWSKEPVLYITSRRYTLRPYALTDVRVYSNQQDVRLTVNGRDLGTAPCSYGTCIWKAVALKPGGNRIEARAGALRDAVDWQLAGTPGHWHMRAGTLVGGKAADGTLWGSDAYATGGKGNFRDAPSASRGANPGPVRPVKGTADQVAYESWREGNFSYAVPMADGRYRVTLHFFEPKADQTRGGRVFGVTAEGRPMIEGLDVLATTGAPMTALSRSFEVQVSGGTLDLAFVPVKGEAVVSGIEIVPAGAR